MNKNIILKDKETKNIFMLLSGEKGTMEEIVPNSVDASVEKHKPVVTVNGKNVKVNVSSVTHPMTEMHYIEFIAVYTNKGLHIRNLTPVDVPEMSLTLEDGEEVSEVYAYCNLHGLWKA